MRRLIHWSCQALALLAAAPALAWGPVGHRVVGLVAEHHLSETAARGVAAILGSESLARAATWPDEIRSDPAWLHGAPERRPDRVKAGHARLSSCSGASINAAAFQYS